VVTRGKIETKKLVGVKMKPNKLKRYLEAAHAECVAKKINFSIEN
jgi:hypothetical protein